LKKFEQIIFVSSKSLDPDQDIEKGLDPDPDLDPYIKYTDPLHWLAQV